MDDFPRHNQIMKDNILHIQQRQQETDMVDGLEILDPELLSDEIWETPVPENFKLPSLAKFDG